MIHFELNFGRWFKIRGADLKGHDLAVTLLFLAFIIVLIVLAIAAIDMSKVQVFL